MAKALSTSTMESLYVVAKNLCFVDDIAAASDSQQGLHSVVGRTAYTSHRMGMCISTEKTEVQHIGRYPTITINQQKLKQAENSSTLSLIHI